MQQVVHHHDILAIGPGVTKPAFLGLPVCLGWVGACSLAGYPLIPHILMSTNVFVTPTKP